jgi:hypothetical protein
MNIRFFAGALIFAIACLLQFSFTSAAITVDFVFATLIAFSFIFPSHGATHAVGRESVFGGGFLELLFFVLAGVFLMNWIPAPSIALAAFAAIPILTYLFCAVFPWEVWIGIVIFLFSGFILLYLITAPRFITTATFSFLLDLFMGSAFGLMTFLFMDSAFE